MPELSLQHIDQISHDIRRQEITFSHLLEDLIDHVCCDVENEMQNGLSFSEAYQKVKQKMGSRRIKEIQKETLYIVDTKYRYMKNTMKIAGVAGTIMLGFAALLKIMHWPGAGILMTFGALLLAIVFLPSALGVLWKETHSRKKLFLFISAFLAGMLFIFGVLLKIQHWTGAGLTLTLAAVFGLFFFIPSLLVSKLREDENRKKRVIYILSAIGSACYTLGVLFKIQHWPLSVHLILTGLLLLFFVVIPLYTWYTWKEEKNVSPRFIFIIVGSLAIIVPGALVTMDMQRSYDFGFFTNQKQQQAMYNSMYMNNQSLLTKSNDSLSGSIAGQIHLKTIELLNYVNDIEAEMVAESEGKPGLPVINDQLFKKTESGQEIQIDLLNSPFHPDPVKDYLLPGCTSRQKLDDAMKSYMSFLSGLSSGGELRRFRRLLDPTTYLPGTPERGDISLMAGLHSLMLLKNGLLTVESNALTSIAKQ
jgi:hypothetical protein